MTGVQTCALPISELQKAKEAAEVAKEAAKAAEEAAYERGMEDVEKRLAKEVTEVCRDYCFETWVEALNRAGVPPDFKLRKAESVFFSKVIKEAPTDLPPTVILSLPPPEQVSDTQVLVGGAEIPMRVVRKGKEVLSSAKDVLAEDSLTIKDMVSQAKVVESKSDAGDAKLKPIDSGKGTQSTKK